jgi:hypothetical protein
MNKIQLKSSKSRSKMRRRKKSKRVRRRRPALLTRPRKHSALWELFSKMHFRKLRIPLLGNHCLSKTLKRMRRKKLIKSINRYQNKKRMLSPNQPSSHSLQANLSNSNLYMPVHHL